MTMLPWGIVAALLLTVVWYGWRWRRNLRQLTKAIDGIDVDTAEGQLVSDEVGPFESLQESVSRLTKRLQERLAHSLADQDRLEAVLGGMVEGVLVIDREGTVLLSNQRAERLLELPPDHEYIGLPLIELTRHPDLHDLVRWVMGEGGLADSSSREIVLDSARQQILQATVTPMEGAGEAGIGFILVFHDISDLKHLERVRRDFVANVSHELRTPLAAISGYTETLLSGALDDPDHARRFLGIIERHTERLGRLVADLLALSDLELGRTELRRDAVNVGVLTEGTFEVLGQKAKECGIVLEHAVDPGTFVDADAHRLEQALVNLVDNGIKYTPRGGHVKVSARLVNDTPTGAPATRPAGPFVEIAVTDTGIGVSEPDLPRLTERFYCVDKARSRDLGGTGLGLAIVKHIVQAHGGWMRIESKLNHGTTVRLYLAASNAADEDRELARAARG
jgi:two-component system phosphate regulon sensor histidine kinase PhoR